MMSKNDGTGGHRRAGSLSTKFKNKKARPPGVAGSTALTLSAAHMRAGVLCMVITAGVRRARVRAKCKMCMFEVQNHIEWVC